VGTERTDNADIIGYEPNARKFKLWKDEHTNAHHIPHEPAPIKRDATRAHGHLSGRHRG
jgi:hypothetical protein